MRIRKSLLSSFALCLLVILLFFVLGFAYLRDKARSEQEMRNQQKIRDLQDLSRHTESFQKLTGYFVFLAEKRGAEYAYDILRNAELPPQTDIHLLAHAIGDVLYQEQGIAGIKICTDEFRNACSHSIVIALFQKYGTKAAKQIADTCRKAPGSKGAYTMCFHGLGHGVLAYAKYDFANAVKLCDAQGTQEYNMKESVECVGGATMEMVSGIHDPKRWEEQKAVYLPKDDPLAPCDKDFVSNRVRPQCYNYLTPHLITRSGGDIASVDESAYQKAFMLCDKIPLTDTASRYQCFGGFGKEFVVLAKNRDIRRIENLTQDELQKVTRWCGLGTLADAITACIISAVNSLLWGTENTPDSAIAFCVLQKEGIEQTCFNHLIKSVAFYQPSERYKKQLCLEVPKEYQNQCEQVLNI